MLNPIQTAQSAKGFTSFGETAKALLHQFPATDWGLKQRSLETQLSKLDRGQAIWWSNHPEAAQSLATLLDLSLEDLGLHGASGNHFFKFSELPGLKPLDLKRETSWQIGHAKSDSTRVSKFGEETLDHWLEPIAGYAWRAPYKVDWLCVPDELERQLLTRRLAATSRYKVLFTETLAAASAQLQDEKPLILVLERDVPDEDIKTLGLRPRDAGLLLIAPNPMPLRQQTSSME